MSPAADAAPFLPLRAIAWPTPADQGDEVTPSVADRVEVRSRNETTTWQVRSVEAVYRRRKLIGTLCQVERLADQRAASVLA